MKAQYVKALDTIAKLGYALKQQIILHSRFTNDGEYNEAIHYLKELGYIKTSENNTDLYITPFGLQWLNTTQDVVKVPDFHEAINFAIDIIKRLYSRDIKVVERDQILNTYNKEDNQFVSAAIDILITEKVLIHLTDNPNVYDVAIERHTGYLYSIA